VGGEIEFITLQPGFYRINIIQYFDQAQEANPGPENQALVYIFSNRTNEVVSTHVLDLDMETPVEYTNITCVIDELQTSRVVWTADIELDPSAYADPEGYYIVWERCCRNGSVVNIVNPLGTGMKYVTEIPPLWKDGAPFINSSPILFQPLNDYACIDQLYYVRFTGTDPDGDSLVYSLTTPLNSSAQVALPIPQPKPHIPVRFLNVFGFDAEEIIPGNPSLSIGRNGLLTVTPSFTGLYVFSVLVEEFRNGAKIGQVQRDFQMLVVDGCDPPDPPVVGIQVPGNAGFQADTDTLRYTVDEDKCFNYMVANVTPGETLSFRAEGVNFEGNIDDIFQFNTIPVANSDSLVVQVCAPGCPPTGSDPFIVDLIAGDDACPLPQLDTLRLVMQVEPPPNTTPLIFPSDFTRFVNENEPFTQRITGIDPDQDVMDIEFVLSVDDDPARYGFEFEVIESSAGNIEAELRWDTDCESVDFSGVQNFRASVFIDDRDVCEETPADQLDMFLNVVLPFNSDPQVSVAGIDNRFIQVDPNQELALDVLVLDPDGDPVNLRMVGDGFDPADLGASMEPSSGVGEAGSVFSWFTDCNFTNPGQDNSFTFFFIGDDVDRCEVTNFDTLALTIEIPVLPNEAPEIQPLSEYVLEVNELFTLDINAIDLDIEDEVTLEFFAGMRMPRSPSLEFPSTTGIGTVSSTLTWQPECALLGGAKSRSYDLAFIAFDNGCPQSRFDTTLVRFEIVETRERFDGFFPPNAFSPNNDNINDHFQLSGNSESILNLPPDNCDDSFEYISIHNRTGDKVFYSDDREFRWDGGNQASGLYFYVIKYTRTEYRNYIQLIR
jgi:hypothetical protein